MDIKSALLAGAIELTALEVGEAPNLATRAITYDGTSHNISKFYEPENTNIDVGVRIHTPASAYDIRIDTGYDTEKYDKKPTLSLGYHTSKWSIIGSLGGDTHHTPCYDEFNRKYYCQTLTAWSDSKPKETDDEKIFITRRFKF